MNLKIDASKSEDIVKSLDEAKESYFSNSKVLDFQNID